MEKRRPQRDVEYTISLQIGKNPTPSKKKKGEYMGMTLNCI